MHRSIIIIMVLILAGLSAAKNERVWIYFSNKGPETDGLIKRGSVALSPDALDRRRIKNIPLNIDDVPVNGKYLNALKATGIKIHRVSRWFNAVSAYLDDVNPDIILDLPFVSSIEAVNGIRGFRKPIESKSSLLKKSASDYGASENQNQMIGVPALHKLGYSGQNVRIALFDTGFLITHEVFDQIRIVDQYDFIQNDRWVANDDEEIITQHNHGTMVLAVIGGYQPGKLIGPAYSSEYILAKTGYFLGDSR